MTKGVECSSVVSRCVLVAVYFKTLKLGLGVEAMSQSVFIDMLHAMYPIVKSMLDKVCEEEWACPQENIGVKAET